MDRSFSYTWKIDWKDFKELSSKSITRRFATAYNNVVLFWRAELACEGGSDKFGFRIYYDDGPHDAFDAAFTFAILKPDQTTAKALATGKFKITKGTRRGWSQFDDVDLDVFKERYRLREKDPIFGRIILEMPASTFSFYFPRPYPGPVNGLLQEIFDRVEDPEKAVYSNAKLVSGDGDAFYCDQVVLGTQSDALAAMLRHPPANGEFPFPTMSSVGLKEFLRYVYTGQTALINIPTTAIIQVADAAEQYGFMGLMEICGYALWMRVAEKPEDCFDVVHFADSFCHLHKNLRYLKHRAMDMLVENWEKVGLESANLPKRFGGDDVGRRLRTEFNVFVFGRVQPTIADEKAQ